MDVDPNTDGFGPFETDPEIGQKIAAAVALVKTDSRQAAIDKLLTIERINRMAAAAPETAAVCVAIIRILHKERTGAPSASTSSSSRSGARSSKRPSRARCRRRCRTSTRLRTRRRC